MAKDTKKDLDMTDKDAAEVKGGQTRPSMKKSPGVKKSPGITKKELR